MYFGSRPSPRTLVVALIATCALTLLTPAATAADAELFPVQLVRVNVPAQADRDRLTNLGLDLTEHGGPTYVEVVLHSAADATRLSSAGFTWTVTIPDLVLRQQRNNKLSAAYAAATIVSPLPSGRDTYRTLGDYNTELRTMASTNPSLVKLVTLSRKTLEGRNILGVEISESVESTTDGKPTFLIMGVHHAREWPSGEHTMEFAFDLVRGYTTRDARIKGLLASARVIAIPVVNPDGFEQSRKWGDLIDVREIDNGGQVTIIGNPGNAYKRKNCRVADGVASTPPGACEPGGRRLWDRRRPQPQLRRPLGRPGCGVDRRGSDIPRRLSVLRA